MAGAGYKLFNTGDVLTAAQVNTYLMEQTVMVFANAAARTTALSGVVSEGMISYLKDTNAVEVYDGSNWVSSDDPNAIQNTIVDAKGDLITATAADTPSRIAVGNNGETLVADSSQTTGLRWAANYGFTAGKNKIINGDFAINQRNFSSTTTSNTYGFDRFVYLCSDGTVTYSAQTFTPGTAPVAGYEAANFARIVTTGQTLSSAEARLIQRIENVRTFANQTITISFWAKANSGTPNVAVECIQNFGTGGSPSSSVTAIIASPAKQAISTSWARYSFTIAVPSISGKTIGTDANSSGLFISLWVSAGSNFDARTGTLGIQTNTFDFWGIQAEAGSVATAFQTATGTLAGELAACQRYYIRYKTDSANTYGNFSSSAWAVSTTKAYGIFSLPVPLRITVQSVESSTVAFVDSADSIYSLSSISLVGTASTDGSIMIQGTISGATANRPGRFCSNASTSGYVAFSSEL